jgi:hypothetical protein
MDDLKTPVCGVRRTAPKRRSNLLARGAGKGASPTRNPRGGMTFRPRGNVGRRLHHALHQRPLRDELHSGLLALLRRGERAYRQNQFDHRVLLLIGTPACEVERAPRPWQVTSWREGQRTRAVRWLDVCLHASFAWQTMESPAMSSSMRHRPDQQFGKAGAGLPTKGPLLQRPPNGDRSASRRSPD